MTEKRVPNKVYGGGRRVEGQVDFQTYGVYPERRKKRKGRKEFEGKNVQRASLYAGGP